MKKAFLTLIGIVLAFSLAAQGSKLPQNITLQTIDGKNVQSSAIQNDGRPIIISFWATWCKPCNLELNNILEVYDEWQEETGVKLVAVSIDDARTAKRVKSHVNGKDWPYEVYIDQNQDLARAMSVGADVPHTFILDGEGNIVWQHKGYQPGGEDEVIARVRELLK